MCSVTRKVAYKAFVLITDMYKRHNISITVVGIKKVQKRKIYLYT